MKEIRRLEINHKILCNNSKIVKTQSAFKLKTQGFKIFYQKIC